MRKILLGTTAVVGAALLAPTMAAAQEAPTVRVGGYFRAYYGHINQTGANVTGTTPQGTVSQPTNSGTVDLGAAGTPLSTNTAQSARTGKNDFSTDAEIHVFVNGKTANGLTYGAVVEIQFDNNEASFRNSRRSQTTKTSADIDEMYAFIASPTLGQIRFGDEDGPFGGLMNAGIVTNFGTGGIYGDWQDFVIRPNRTTTSPGDVGDNTKIIYLSPQLFGFDFGASWAFNEGTGGDTGCNSSLAGTTCDRAYAATGVTGFGRGNDSLPGRRNEHQAMLRWRGSFAGVGLAASAGYFGAQAVLDQTVTGTVARTLRNPQMYQAGLQATAYGFTLGANYQYGNTNFFYIPTIRGGKNQSQIFAGGSYTAGPFSIGANYFFGTYEGTGGSAFSTTTGVLSQNTNGTKRGQRRYGFGIGANYRLAPGLDLIAEYVRHVIHENGVDLDLQGNNGVQDKLRADVLIVGTRLAF